MKELRRLEKENQSLKEKVSKGVILDLEIRRLFWKSKAWIQRNKTLIETWIYYFRIHDAQNGGKNEKSKTC